MESLIQEEFTLRQDDIDLIIELTEKISKGKRISVHDSSGETIEILEYGEKTVNVLKSALFLLAYNQVESTMRGCLEQLYDDITDNNIGYDELKSEIQTTILKGLLKNYQSGGELKKVVQNQLNLKSPSASLKIKKVFNGNIEASTIYDIRDTYSIKISPKPTDRNGVDITTLKEARNDLAHGNISFSEFGGRHPFETVKETVSRSSSYLISVIEGFQTYLDSKGYKA
ncbi:MAE_28990/MAE_18760 family HEPN-like nuclease [Vibrio cholerae]|uniref:MAE_28990/MAE_18760 family HEPN-like nuclease n=2 Tax=Vibrio cholerae TaxID=666 RepID=UPI0011F062E4|nr:MAE_28990/MAE_18760 family HEPN-like nuclease [Vibrio cholerae]EGR3918669.1 hypothetical protein [Vibrio cholerae]TYW31194.1 hypothetical protein FY537_13555 [Vibrio cholerae]GHZ08634.1 hypothetical protein VCSRO28_1375 [Vibrio cholerae]